MLYFLLKFDLKSVLHFSFSSYFLLFQEYNISNLANSVPQISPIFIPAVLYQFHAGANNNRL